MEYPLVDLSGVNEENVVVTAKRWSDTIYAGELQRLIRQLTVIESPDRVIVQDFIQYLRERIGSEEEPALRADIELAYCLIHRMIADKEVSVGDKLSRLIKKARERFCKLAPLIEKKRHLRIE